MLLFFSSAFSILIFAYCVYLLILSKVCTISIFSSLSKYVHIHALISLNVKGLSNFRKRRARFLWSRKRKADLVFSLQETHSIAATENQWRNEWGSEMISFHGSSNSQGVVILFKNGIDCRINHKILDPEGRYIILKACIQDKDYVLINAYAPNKDKYQY